nr:MAG TPA: hypothetical protein [Caudoviricetes sp.]
MSRACCLPSFRLSPAVSFARRIRATYSVSKVQAVLAASLPSRSYIYFGGFFIHASLHEFVLSPKLRRFISAGLPAFCFGRGLLPSTCPYCNSVAATCKLLFCK